MVKVSVIVPAYNLENYIEKCIYSLINQTLDDIEIIIVNDGSTDSTLDIIRNIEQEYSIYKNIKVIDKINEGVNTARRIGFEKAQGEYVLFVDGDDWLELDALQILYKEAKLNDSDILIYNAIWDYGTNQEKNKIFQNECNENQDYLELVLTNKILPSLWSKFVRKGFIIEHNIKLPEKIAYGEDLVMSVSLFINKPKVKFLDKYLYYYYQRPSSVSNNISSKLKDIVKSMTYIKNILDNKEIYFLYEEQYNYLVFYQVFVRQIAKSKVYDTLQKEIYKEYKFMGISMKNKYIKKFLQESSKSFRFKIYLFDKSYFLGKLIYLLKLQY